MTHRVAIIGGGFAGLTAARSLRHAAVEITLIDRRNFHLFQPLLYQVATGGLSPGNIAAPLRAVLRGQCNCTVLLGEAIDFDLAARNVLLSDGEVPYDTLIVCAGARTAFFGHDDWAQHARGLKSIEDALDIRARVLSAFEAAERETVPDRQVEWLTFVIVGGGPTGVELAGTLAEIARHTLRREFRRINPSDARIVLVEMSPHLLNGFAAELAADAQRRLARMHVDVRTSTRVVELKHEAITLQDDSGSQTLRTRTVLWAAGVAASPLGERLAQAAQCSSDRMGRVMVTGQLTLPGFPEVFVIGDMAHCAGPDGKPLPGVAPVAMQQAKYVAALIVQRLKQQTSTPFRYRDPGTMATIGRSAAIVQLGRYRFTGWVAWFMWLMLHLLMLVEFENRLLVLIQWAWNYFTFNRSARLITDVRLAQETVEPKRQPQHEKNVGDPLQARGSGHVSPGTAVDKNTVENSA